MEPREYNRLDPLANKTYNLKISTPDGESIGAWYTLADPYYNSLSLFPPASDEHITQSLKRYPTMLFLHGNAATRAFKARVQQYQAFSSRLAVNVLAIDYRGFGDSTGTPTEAGVVIDARAAWDWLLSRGARPENVIIIGHSLGTGIGGRLASILSDEGVKYRGVVLMSPFSSIEELLKTYSLLGFIPLIKPLQIFPYAASKSFPSLECGCTKPTCNRYCDESSEAPVRDSRSCSETQGQHHHCACR